MRMLATTEQMRELDRTAIEERGIPSLELVENAAREVAQAVADLVGPVKGPGRTDGSGARCPWRCSPRVASR